jgi:hypothetical protein
MAKTVTTFLLVLYIMFVSRFSIKYFHPMSGAKAKPGIVFSYSIMKRAFSSLLSTLLVVRLVLVLNYIILCLINHIRNTPFNRVFFIICFLLLDGDLHRDRL